MYVCVSIVYLAGNNATSYVRLGDNRFYCS